MQATLCPGSTATTATAATAGGAQAQAPKEEKKNEGVAGGNINEPREISTRVHAPPGGKSSGPLW